MHQNCLAFARDVAAQAGEIMRRHFVTAASNHVIKDDQTPLSLADTEINRLVIDAVAQHFPAHSVLGEEESSATRTPQLWVCDPVDGTFPFTHGIPAATFNLAYVEEGVPQVGVTFDPFQNRLYEAVRGGGSWLNGQRLDLSASAPLARSALSVEVRCGKGSIITDPEAELAIYRFIVENGQVPVHLCSGAYEAMLVASGEANGVIFGGCNPWDGAAISLIVNEAGGCVTDLRGQDQRYDGKIYGFIAARPEWHGRLVELVQPYILQQ